MRLMVEQFDFTSQPPVTWIFNKCNLYAPRWIWFSYTRIFPFTNPIVHSKFSIYMQRSLILMLKWIQIRRVCLLWLYLLLCLCVSVWFHVFFYPSLCYTPSYECFMFKAINVFHSLSYSLVLKWLRPMCCVFKRILNFLTNSRRSFAFNINCPLVSYYFFFLCKHQTKM